MMAFLIIVCVVTSVALFILALAQVAIIILGRKSYSKQIKYPKAGNSKQYCIGFILFLLVAMTGCKPTGTLSNGCTYKLNPPKFKA